MPQKSDDLESKKTTGEVAKASEKKADKAADKVKDKEKDKDKIVASETKATKDKAAPEVKDAKPIKDEAVAKTPEAVESADEGSTARDAREEKNGGSSKASVFTGGVPRVKLPANWKQLAIRVGAGLVALLALVVIVFGALIYGYHSESPTVKAVAGVIPYPVAKVNGSLVSYSDYLFQLDANKRGYQQNAKLNNQPAVDYNSSNGKKILSQFRTSSLQKVKTDAVVAQLAKQNKVSVTDKDVNNLIDELYKNYGGKDTLLKTLKDIYGWNLGDLKKVVRRQLLEQKVSQKIAADPAVDAQAKASATTIAQQIKDGADFAELAKQKSQASDAASGGDLGTFSKGQVSDEIQKAVDALQVGQVSDPVKDQYGYEIIKVNEKNGDTAHASHILIKTVDLNDYLDKKVKAAKYQQYIKV